MKWSEIIWKNGKNEMFNKRNEMKKRIRKIWEVKNEMKGSEMKWKRENEKKKNEMWNLKNEIRNKSKRKNKMRN